ncbi:NAD(P)/FAD-dependent oxidoreductase [Pseudokordiimonas caeni]|uniref:NAD(P)/FAD-dependent oxidoreductase n=1 Tax=Pseudokordiimonas caeni TaxID=2997908 RepID=UPI002812272F|nr:FAD-dependent oxidoreductase [Pseudokordiimonas caeni]
MQDRNVTIVGGGIIGLMTAYHLMERGIAVTIIDAVPPGDRAQTSYGNAGSISIGNVLPLGKPGFVMDGIRMTLDPESPLVMPVSYMPRIAPWLYKVWRASGPATVETSAKASALLSHESLEAWQALVADLKLGDLVRPDGWLKLYETEASFEKTAKERALMDRFGFGYRVLDPDALAELEPGIAPIYPKAILQTQSLAIRNPGRCVSALASHLLARGAAFTLGRVTHIERTEGGYYVKGEGIDHLARELVIAGGAWSNRLLKGLGISVPLETERGYHLMFDGGSGLSRPTVNMNRYFVLCPMEQGLRMTACVELAGLDAKPDYRRIRRLVAHAKRMLPGMATDERDQWLGFRPSMPDTRPVIGEASGHKGLYLAFGHGHMGMTHSAGTGRLLAGLIASGEGGDVLAPFTPSRFGA